MTAEIVRGWDLALTVLPITDDRLRTMVTIDEQGDGDVTEIGFQEYFVQRRHDVEVRSVRFDGADAALAGPGVLDALAGADRVVIAPSNPIVSIGPLLAVPGVRDAVVARRADPVAVSPIIAGAALKGPADRLLRELGHESSVVGVARLYRDLAATLVIDDADAHLAPAVEAEGLRCVVTPTIMSGPDEAAALGRTVLPACPPPPPAPPPPAFWMTSAERGAGERAPGGIRGRRAARGAARRRPGRHDRRHCGPGRR